MSNNNNVSDTMLSVKDLKIHFPIKKGVLQRQVGAVLAVDGVTFDIFRGETFGLVGESGCGKTTTGRAILQLYEPTAGEIVFDGINLTHLDTKDLRDMRKRMQMIFQDPFASLNPRLAVGMAIAEPIRIHTGLDKENIEKRVNHLLEVVGLSPDVAGRFPHEFSGGQRQRIGIARALASEPDFVVCDEPISALDVSIQAQVVNLIEDLRSDIGLTYLFIGHDLSMIRHISDRVAVMYLGQIVELAETNQLFLNALNPYTVSLISAIPVPDPIIESERQRIVLEGDVPNPSDPPKGCLFSTRCPLVVDECINTRPLLKEWRPGHFAACHRIDEMGEGRGLPAIPSA
tara:strand:- start:3897 stop:4931 length:1035 start_codon:yes stop_codon:yes gene_type:complete